MSPDAGKIPRIRAFSQSLPMALLRAREAVMRKFRPALRTHGVTEQQWRVLRALTHSGPLEVTTLAQATFLLAPSLSRILPDMEERGLVVRRQLDTDMRRAVVSLGPNGLRLIAIHAPHSERTYENIARRFGSERLTQLFTLLHELEEVLAADGESEVGVTVDGDPAAAGGTDTKRRRGRPPGKRGRR